MPWRCLLVATGHCGAQVAPQTGQLSATECQSAEVTHIARPFSSMVSENLHAAVIPLYSICGELSAAP